MLDGFTTLPPLVFNRLLGVLLLTAALPLFPVETRHQIWFRLRSCRLHCC